MPRPLPRASVAAVVLGAVTACWVPPAAAYIDSNLAVSPAAHANDGGCYATGLVPGLLDQLVTINPEWAAVDVGSHTPPEADPITIHGTVTLAKINEGGDNSANHATDDQNTFLDVDPADEGYVATGNLGPHGEEAGELEVEWEIGSYPLFAWAGTGDRMTAAGRWIWDCGHADPDPPGSCSVTATQPCAIDTDCAPPACPACAAGETCLGVTFNYHSELHPPQAVAVTRLGQGFRFHRDPAGGRRPSTRTDVWISPDGGGAGDRCVVTHRPSPAEQIGLVCFPLSQPLADVNAADFAFDVPLPPRPPRATRPRVKVFDRTPRGLPRPRVTTTFADGAAPVVHAVVRMTEPVRGKLPSHVGKAIVAGWRRDRTRLTRLRVEVTALEILNPLKAATPLVAERRRCSVTTAQDCSTAACPAGETCLALGGPIAGWEVFAEVNGHWQRLADLAGVLAPGTIPQALSYDVALPADGRLRLHVTGHSLGCREALAYGKSFGQMIALLGFVDGQSCLTDESRHIGHLGDDDNPVVFTAPDFGSGGSSQSHVTQSVGGDGGTCSASTARLCIGDDDCPAGETCVETGGAFRLHYTITKRP